LGVKISIKQTAHEIIDQLDDQATWNDLVKELYLQKKITLGMTDLEVVKKEIGESDVNGIIARLESASKQPSDMRNTRTYQPGNYSTMGMIAGVVAVLFAFVFPPISWVAAPIAFISGVIGLTRQEEKSWVPILLAIVSTAPVLMLLID